MPGQGDITESFGLEQLRQSLGGAMDVTLRSQGGLGQMLLQRPFVLHSRHTARVLVLTPDGCPAAVLICSPALQPDHVERAVARTRQAKEVLGPELGKPVLQPLTAGRHEGLSYALWPYRFPLSDRRGLWRLQRYWLRPHLFRWLRQTTRRTLQTPSSSGMENDFAVPFQALVDGREVNARIREQAKEVLERLRAGTWKPVHVFEHNDLWKGNILLNAPMPRCLLSRPADGLFSIIDWRGAKANGHGFYDLVRLAQSLQASRGQLADEVEAHGRILGCSLADVRGHLLASLGHLRLNLEGFPVERFMALAASCGRTLDLVLEETD
mgnify:FL=1